MTTNDSCITKDSEDWIPVSPQIPPRWLYISFEDALKPISTSKIKIAQKDYLVDGVYPVIDQGQSFIGGYTNTPAKIIREDRAVIVFGDHTRCFKLVTFPFVPGADGTKVVKPSRFLDEKFAYYACLSFRFPDRGYSRHYSFLRQSKFPVAPINEQHRIAAKIEALFSKLDNGIASFKAAQEKLTIYRQAVLKKAFEGKLTRGWREQQTNLQDTGVLLKQIKTDLDDYYQQQLRDWQVAVKAWTAKGKEGKKPSKPKKNKVITELTKEDLSKLPELPNEWCWRKLGSICQKLQIGPFGSQMHRHDYVEKGVPVVNPQHIKSQKIFPRVFISKDKAESLPQYVLKENDIILGRRGEMGRSACISRKENGWFCGSGSLFIRMGNMFNGVLYSLILSERRVVQYLEAEGGGTTMTNLNSTILNELPIQLIPLEEQAQITKEIESRFSVCDHLQQEIERGLQKAEALRQSVLKKAFEGQFTHRRPS